jgi:hypothetical protein
MPRNALVRFQPIDLTGRTFGRMKVIGLYAERNPNLKQKATWVVRCSCGVYEVCKARTINNPKNSNHCCSVCHVAAGQNG